MATQARDCKHYDELVQLVKAQPMDPFTGFVGGDKPPGVSGCNGEWSKDIQNRFGKYKMDNGDVYKGDILDNKMHGKG